MLSNLKYMADSIPVFEEDSAIKSRRNRNEGEDMQKAIALLYDFKVRLDELHPRCVELIEHMLQRPRY